MLIHPFRPVGQGRIPVIPPGVRLALAAVGVRRAQAGLGQGGQGLWIFDPAADRHPAGFQPEPGQEAAAAGPAHIWQPAKQQGAKVQAEA